MHEHEPDLGQPSITENLAGGALTRSYRWETQDKKQIFLYVTYSLKQSQEEGPFLLATSNFDSSEVKGKGNFLLQFCMAELTRAAKEGIGHGFPLIPILHEVKPNEYSRPLFEKNSNYVQRGNNFYGFYEP